MKDVVYADENGRLHRPWQDGPAEIWKNGAVFYVEHGKYHRPSSEGPAIVREDGGQFYW